jgi:hypothetical protein
MHPAVAVDRELLLATAHRHEADQTSEALCGILIAAGELVYPGTLPTVANLDISDVIVGEHTADVPVRVVQAVRRRLQHHAAAAGAAAEQFACARAARELAAVELELA